jgi:hypothetical protein
VFTRYIEQFVGVPEKYAEEVEDFWKDLTAFNYAQWDKRDLGTTRKDDFYGSSKFDSEAKEELFTKLIENKLGKDFLATVDAELESMIDETGATASDLGDGILKKRMPGPTGKQMGIQKILVTAETLQPGSAKILIAYAANKQWADYAKKYGPKNAD